MGNSDHAQQQPSKRPRQLASDCQSLAECEKRQSHLAESIQSKTESLGHKPIATEEQRQAVRELNDEINRLMRAKFQWEAQIRRLGGSAATARDDYLYFGAARQLPEVVALLSQAPPSLAEQQQDDDEGGDELPSHEFDPSPEYYGFLSNDKELARLEQQVDFQAPGLVPIEIERESEHWDEAWPAPSKRDVDHSLLEFKKKQLMQRFHLC